MPDRVTWLSRAPCASPHSLPQTVSFVGGKPVFAKYMDSFPFPFYIVLRDTGGQLVCGGGKGRAGAGRTACRCQPKVRRCCWHATLSRCSTIHRPAQPRCHVRWRTCCASGLS